MSNFDNNFHELIQRYRGVTVTIIVDSTAFPIAIGEVIDGPNAVPGFLNLKLTAPYDSLNAGTIALFSFDHIIAIG